MILKKYILGELLSKIENGAVIKQNKGATGIPITRIETLSNGFFNRDKFGYADIEDPTLYANYVLEDNDLLMSHINSKEFVGRTVIYKKQANECIIHGMNLLRIKTNAKLLDPEFTYYYFQTDTIKRCLYNLRKDAIGQSSIAISDIKNMIVSVPNISIQKEIAFVLRCYDRRIELNQAINQNLEAMAKQLYDYWFVQFDFPDENGRTYKSSGGKMVWNEKLKRDIPISWETKLIDDVAEIYNGATPSTINELNYGGDIVWITPKDLSDQKQKFVYKGERNISQVGYDSCSTHLLPLNTILISSRAPIGLLAIAKTELCTNQGFKSFVPKSGNTTIYLYYYLQHHIRQIEQLGTGTTFKEVSREDILKFPMLKPSDNVLDLWEEMVSALNDRQLEIQKENESLTKQRDELLPLLMNGQVSVNSDLIVLYFRGHKYQNYEREHHSGHS